MNHGQEIPAVNIPSAVGAEVQPHKRPSYWIHILLFVATVFTTMTAGAIMMGADPFSIPASIVQGIPFSFTLMTILLTHEMGHYLTARHYGVQATLPYFIPAPPFFLIGTFGAFIRMKSPIFRKRAILEIGAAGPIAGFVVAIVALYFGLKLSPVVSVADLPGFSFKEGDSLLYSFLKYILLDIPEGSDVLLHPVAFAGWIGLFVTALNLIPIGQLDGGHVVYALLGKRHTLVSIAMVGVLLVMGFIAWPGSDFGWSISNFGWPGWYIWAFLTTLLGVRHPPMMDPESVLEPKQKLIGWASLVIFVLTFTPNPFTIQ